MQFIKDTAIDFIGKRKIALTISGILILLGIVSLVLRGGPNYGIDFTGGTSLQIRFENPVDVGTLRNILSGMNLGNTEIKEFSAHNEFLVRIQQVESAEDLSDVVVREFKNNLPDNELEIRMRETVGPRIGNELRRSAIWSVLIALILILIYISYRFEFMFAIGAVAALFHDVMITLGLFSFLNLEISLAVVASFLTIIGYSLNDTIVVFDRIRENMK
ncbi:protein translocase subunit SecF, partial [candidate division KSB1 bacterium 4572_119]